MIWASVPEAAMTPEATKEQFAGADAFIERVDFSALPKGEAYVVVASHGNYDEEAIRAALDAALAPAALDIEDQSHLHAGHAGARDGRGHFRVDIVSEAFAGRNAVARHRAVYAALGELMSTDIHALSLRARTPQEAADGG